MKCTVWFLMLSLAPLGGCAATPASPAPGPIGLQSAAYDVERLPPVHAAPPAILVPQPAAKKSFWRRLWPWDDERDARPKTQREIDDDFKWRNNG